MPFYKHTFLYSFILIGFLGTVLHHHALTEYSFTLGSKTITPKENLNTFFKNKEVFKANLHDGEYYVIVQFYKAPTASQENTIRRHLSLIQGVTKNTYIASFSSNLSKRKLKKLKVRAIVGLDKAMKLEKGLEATFEKEVTQNVNIIVSKNIDKEFVVNQLQSMDIPYVLEMFRETNNKHMIKVNAKQLSSLAQLAWIVQIETGGMR